MTSPNLELLKILLPASRSSYLSLKQLLLVAHWVWVEYICSFSANVLWEPGWRMFWLKNTKSQLKATGKCSSASRLLSSFLLQTISMPGIVPLVHIYLWKKSGSSYHISQWRGTRCTHMKAAVSVALTFRLHKLYLLRSSFQDLLLCCIMRSVLFTVLIFLCFLRSTRACVGFKPIK